VTFPASFLEPMLTVSGLSVTGFPMELTFITHTYVISVLFVKSRPNLLSPEHRPRAGARATMWISNVVPKWLLINALY